MVNHGGIVDKQLQLLTELQKFDSHILSISKKINLLPLEISTQDNNLKKIEQIVEDFNKQISALEKKKKDKEMNIQDLSEKIERQKSKSTGIKTNKEFQSYNKEIEGLQKNIKIIEENVLDVMERIEQLSKNLELEKNKFAQEKSNIEKIKQSITEEMATLKTNLDLLKGERKNFVVNIDKDYYEQYISLCKDYYGVAVVEAKNEICQGCNIQIPPQLFIEIKKDDSIITCPQCRRILYFKEVQSNNQSIEINLKELKQEEYL